MLDGYARFIFLLKVKCRSDGEKIETREMFFFVAFDAAYLKAWCDTKVKLKSEAGDDGINWGVWRRLIWENIWNEIRLK